MQQPLTKTFHETAVAAHDAFPQELKTLVLLLLPASDAPVYVSPEIADQLTKSTAAVKKIVKEKADMLQKMGAAGHAKRDFDFAGMRVNLISLVDAEHYPPGDFSRRFTKKMRVIYNLDHEIGHHILKGGMPYGSSWPAYQFAESVCDAYATLRHIQRFGKSTDRLGGYGESRASLIVLNPDIAHYTTDAVQRALEIAEEKDISSLSLRETAELAEKIADECRIDDDMIKKLCTAFQPVYAAVKNNIGAVPEIMTKLYGRDKEAYKLFCRETLAVMKKHRRDPDIFKAGKQFLSYPAIKKFMTESAKTDSYYKDALGFIDNPQTRAPKKPRLQKPKP